MGELEKKAIPFILGLCVGHYGVRWFIHVGYLVGIAAAFLIGKHIGG